jgi:GNAT superfamily N-acetyltransferase
VTEAELRADPALVEQWVFARALARGTALPVREAGGLRVDTGLAEERRRYVFADVGEGLRALAETIADPLILLKACVSAEALRPFLPARWGIAAPAFMMICDGAMRGVAALPDGYRLEGDQDGPVSAVRIVAADGTLAASGWAARYGDVLVYDRIRTEAAYLRRGLGRALMGALEEAGGGRGRLQLLVATPEGRALYATLGWSLHALYSTATLSTPSI